MNTSIKDYQEIAKSKLTECGKDICKEYTFGWGGPIEWAEEKFPYIKPNIVDIKNSIPDDLPICVFQTKDLPPSNMVAIIPYKTPDGNPTNTRVLSTDDISQNVLKMITEFSQAFLFLLNTGALPSPQEGEQLKSTLISLTDRRLIMA